MKNKYALIHAECSAFSAKTLHLDEQTHLSGMKNKLCATAKAFGHSCR